MKKTFPHKVHYMPDSGDKLAVCGYIPVKSTDDFTQVTCVLCRRITLMKQGKLSLCDYWKIKTRGKRKKKQNSYQNASG
jgi:hypothetical protein